MNALESIDDDLKALESLELPPDEKEFFEDAKRDFPDTSTNTEFSRPPLKDDISSKELKQKDDSQLKKEGLVSQQLGPSPESIETGKVGQHQEAQQAGWEPPAKSEAQLHGKSVRWRQGNGRYFRAQMSDFEELGVGVYLYFYLLLTMAWVFGVMTLLSLPSMVFSATSNGLLANSKTASSLQPLAQLSLGNMGDCQYDDDLLSVSCNNTTMCSGRIKVEEVSYAVSALEFVLAAGWLLMGLWLSRKVEAVDKHLSLEVASPSSYTVLVKGMPEDVVPSKLLHHFNGLYDLSKEQLSYPVMGLSVSGVAVLLGCIMGIVVCAVAGPTLSTLYSHHPAWHALSICGVTLLAGLCTVCMVLLFKIGKPRIRKVPRREYDLNLKKVLEECERVERRRKRNRKIKDNEQDTPTLEDRPRSSEQCSVPILSEEEDDDSVTPNKHEEDRLLTRNSEHHTVEMPSEDGTSGITEQESSEKTDQVISPRGDGAVESEEIPTNTPPRMKRKIKVVPIVQIETDALVDDSFPQQTSTKRNGNRKSKRKGHLPRLIPEPPLCKPVADVRNTGSRAFFGTWIADLRLGHPDGAIINYISAREETLHLAQHIKDLIEKYKAKNKSKKAEQMERKRKKLGLKMEKLEKKVEKLDLKKQTLTCAAFVTFNNEESALRCKYDYRYSRYWFFRQFQPKALRLSTGQHFDSRGRPQLFRLQVTKAAEPSDVLWENLEIGWKERMVRYFITTLITILLLAGSFVFIYEAQEFQTRITSNMPDLSICSSEIPAVFFGSYDMFQPNVTLQRDLELEALCPGDTFGLHFGTLPANLPDFIVPGSNVTVPRKNVSSLLCDSGCFETSSKTSCSYLSCAVEQWQAGEFGSHQCSTYQEGTVVTCYCRQVLEAAIYELGVIKAIEYMYKNKMDICGNFSKTYATWYALVIVSALVVVFVNTLLKVIMISLANFEKHATLSGRAVSLTLKIAFAQFLNTAILTLIINSNISRLQESNVAESLNLFSGSYDDFSREWYASIGSSLTFTMIINTLGPHSSPLIKALVVFPLKRCFKRSSAVNQEEMNKLYEPPVFQIETRYGYLLSCVFITMMYGAGLPLLYLVAFFTVTAAFLLDKAFLVKWNAKPPMYDSGLAFVFVGLMPFAMVIHLFFACYMLGAPSILETPIVSATASYQHTSNPFWNHIAPRVLQSHVFPLFFLLLLLVLSLSAGEIILVSLRNTLGRLFECCQKHIPKLEGLKARYTGELVATLPEEVFRHVVETGVLPPLYTERGWRLKRTTSGNDEPITTMVKTWGAPPLDSKAHPAQGSPQLTWEYLAELGPPSYDIQLNDAYKASVEYLHALLAKKKIRRRSTLHTQGKTTTTRKASSSIEQIKRKMSEIKEPVMPKEVVHRSQTTPINELKEPDPLDGFGPSNPEDIHGYPTEPSIDDMLDSFDTTTTQL